MKKEKYLQIFNYLKEFSKLRSNPVRDIDAQENQYPEKLWLSDLPIDENIQNILLNRGLDSDAGYWVKIKKPKEPAPPTFNRLPENLKKWVKESSLTDEDGGPYILESIEEGEITLNASDFPTLKKELSEYVEKVWEIDLQDYKRALIEYEPLLKKYESVNNSYKLLFKLFNKSQQFGEQYELVVGVGLLNFKENNESPRIFRHILTQKVEINFTFSQKDSELVVSPLESMPQIETDSIIDLFDLFDSQNIIDAEKALEAFIQEKNIFSLFDDIKDGIQMFAERVSPDGNYQDILEKPLTVSNKPLITFSPTLILRKRNTRSLTALYEKILSQIKIEGESIEIATLDDLIGIKNDSDEERFKVNDSFKGLDDNIIYFPKEYNDEQIEIVNKTRKNNKVLVQGPPGTGKSHTIANLICHLLANGNKVLVTAQTKRALEVLKEKLPKDFQKLSVNLLSGDSNSVKDLEASVNAINAELSSHESLSYYTSSLEQHGREFKRIKEEIAEKTNKLLLIKESSTRSQAINEYYEGTLSEIAEKIEKNSHLYDWYKDDYSDIEDNSLFPLLINFIELHKNWSNANAEFFELDIPDKQKIINSEVFRDVKKAEETLSRIIIPENEKNDLDQNCALDYDQANKLRKEISNLIEIQNEIDKFQSDYFEKIRSSFLRGEQSHWADTLDKARVILDNIKSIDLADIDSNFEVIYPEQKSLIQLKNDAKVLLNYLKKGNALSGLKFKLQKSFLSQEIKEKVYFIEGVRVNGSPCDTVEEYETVLRDIQLKQQFFQLNEIFGKDSLDINTYHKKYLFYEQIYSEVEKLNSLVNNAWQTKKNIQSEFSWEITFFDKEHTKIIFEKAMYLEISQGKLLLESRIAETIAYLNQENIHPVRDEIIRVIQEADEIAYETLILKIDNLQRTKEYLIVYNRIGSEIRRKLPSTIELIEAGKLTEKDLDQIKEAIYFRNAQKQISKLTEIDSESLLSKDLDELEKKERTLTSKIASKKAWLKVIDTLQNNRTLRQHLTAWVEAVKKIGVTGKGKKALKFQRLAQEQMEYCKDSVPCWIMPLYKVAETVSVSQGMYDYVIIDEASQLGPDAIFLLYIAKKIIIVGDDKQTSPEYVGIDANAMTPHIKNHLKGIPFSDFYGTEYSFFDLAKLFCEGITVLREHFRCMPEIIEFSNRHFYAPEGKGLYPLKQYSENRLNPLITEFCSNGYTEGEGSRIINRPEAERIVNTIAKIINEQKYDDKSIGVITLQGNQQASLIEDLLIKKIGEKEYYKRKIVCGNSSSFQGDERDIVFLSLVTAQNHKRAQLVKPEDQRRFNVAVSRAKEQALLFHSVQLDDLNPNDLRYKILDHFKNYNSYQKPVNVTIERNLNTQPEPFDSWFEVDVYNDIIEKGLSVIPQYEVANGRYRIDMVALFPDGTKIAIECDGDNWHGPEQFQSDLVRQKVLERCGWQFFRVRGYEYYSNREKALEPLWEIFRKHSEKAENNNHFQESDEVNPNDEVSVITLNDQDELNANSFNKSSEKDDQILKYFNLYHSGLYRISKTKDANADYSISIRESQKNGFLLQCYASGHINKVYIQTLLSKKTDKEYMNGLNRHGDLISIDVIDSEKVLGIYFNERGVKKFKAHLTENISTREQLQLQGYKVIYNEFEKIDYKFFPIEVEAKIHRLIFHSFTANGKHLDNNNYDLEWHTLKQFNSDFKKPESSSSENINSDLENRVTLNSIVSIRYLDSNKTLKVKLVKEATYVEHSIINGVQLININRPLGYSINGKKIGDQIRIEGTNTEIEILEIG
jgi:superfamily I DNA and/or RNA helicase/very-short-patch-repair endonuclease